MTLLGRLDNLYILLQRRWRGEVQVDYNFVTGRLATGGGIVTSGDVDGLARVGITAVIDCREEFDDAALLSCHPDILYCWDGTKDDGQPKPAAWFAKGINFALSVLAKPATAVYSHCAAGQNRGPSMTLAILIAQGLTPDLAEQLIRRARPQVTLAYKQDAIAACKALGYLT